jgi:Bacterial Ig-like domain (group 2)
MSLSSGRPARLLVFQFALLGFAVGLGCLSTSAQQPKVLVPHVPVAPPLPYSPPSADSYRPRVLKGGFWMTDAFTKSSVYVRSNVETAAVTVNPVVYLSNGTKVSLAPVTLKPAGTTVININDGLAAHGLAPYATLSGYVELQYSWPWDALCATISNVDVTHSVIFTFGLNPPTPSHTAGHASQVSTRRVAGKQALEGAWWKEEIGVSGFLTLSNTTEEPLPATVQVSDANANALGAYTVTVSPHGTKRVELQELAPVTNSLGGLGVTFNGTPDALIVNGVLEDLSKGYSAGIPFGPAPPKSVESSTVTYAEVGLMTGAADPMMHFPAGTVFKPYSVIHNLATQPISVTPVLYWMQGGGPLSSRLSPFALSPLQTKNLEVPSLLALSGLKDFNGTVNLALEVQGPAGSALLASGSVDQSSTYVFEVVPRVVSESASKNLSYWTTANGDDTMVTLWNPADEAQDFVFTISFSNGHYLLPVHLGPRATHIFNISEVIENQIPDSEGNVIPLSAREGGAKLSGPHGENEHILVSMDAGTYNVRKGTCTWHCVDCNGSVDTYIEPKPFGVKVAGSIQLALTDEWNTGNKYDLASSSTWTSSNTSVATVSKGLVHGVALGSVNITGQNAGEVWAGQVCGTIPRCPPDQGVGDTAPGNVGAVPVNFEATTMVDAGGGDLHLQYAWESSTGNLPDLASCTVDESVSYPGTGNYSWPAPFPAITSPNPTPGPVPGSDGGGPDDHWIYPKTKYDFRKPYSTNSFAAYQTISYSCTEGGKQLTATLVGPVTIVRSVANSGSWYFEVWETFQGTFGSATINPLP